MSEAPKTNWYDAFPAPKATAALLSREAALASLSSSDLLLVDVRRTDYEGGTIRGSINLPAQSFYMNTAVLYNLCKRAGVKQVAFYCGSSSGRGPRCSGWFADYLAERGETDIQSLTLVGGIKGWVKAGASFTQAVDGYDPEYWKQFDESN
ncbi:hypothetical protein PMIN06_011799 [Paraphaeosphaeria minitans]|uniref:Arsenate reductase n=1 Tax=Paraphaeosphaeria minitans TaxID=565426 RepID=A0A9P6KQL2_9PLEO|nr:arsenate reductase [Paraphaeosphaeria minitans]